MMETILTYRLEILISILVVVAVLQHWAHSRLERRVLNKLADSQRISLIVCDETRLTRDLAELKQLIKERT